MINKLSYVYIVTNHTNSTLYTGVCDNLIKRIWEHKNGVGSEFTSKYKLTKLDYYEVFEDIREAIKREKQIKGGSRKRKIKLINAMNLAWRDLYTAILK